jgi:DivIVA domain-containing protein
MGNANPGVHAALFRLACKYMAGESKSEEIQGPPEPGRKVSRVRSRVPDHEIAEVRDVDFPIAMRGYERAAVDAYVSRVNRLLAELQITAAPESAIRHALDEVADETRGLLERAHETAEEITARSRSKADDREQLAEREAEQVRQAADEYSHEIREAAEKHLRALQADAERVWQERSSLLSELRELSAHIEEVAAGAVERYPTPPNLDTRAAAAETTPLQAVPPPNPDADEDAEPSEHPFPLDDD